MNGVVKQVLWFVLILAVLAGFGLRYTNKPLPKRLDDHTLSHTPDAIVKGLNVSQFDEQGRLSNALSTPLLRHIPDNDTHVLATPLIVVAQPNQPHWKITSTEAKAIQGGREIIFTGDVTVHQDATATTPYSTLRTASLTYYPAQQLAATAMNVVFERPGAVVKSKGMRANLADKHIQLLNKAQAVFEPNHG